MKGVEGGFLTTNGWEFTRMGEGGVLRGCRAGARGSRG